MAGRILKSKDTGLYLAGWDLFGKPKFIDDVNLADNMNYPTAKRVAENLEKVFNEGAFEILSA